jgi:CRISPR/Cas system-associated endonuclease Cas3-HD
MPDDLKNSGAPDRSRVNVNEEHELRYWMKELAVSEAKLREIVGKVGVSADKVRQAAQSM